MQYDLLLQKPIAPLLLRGLLFGTFTLHLLFVLFMLGTGILTVYFLLADRYSNHPEAGEWSKQIRHTFVAHHGLAVVLGIGPLLLIQVGFTVPFFTAVTLLAPVWMGIIGLLIVAFLSLDYLDRRAGSHRRRPVIMGLIGLGLLLVVPGIFVAVLTVTENPAWWPATASEGWNVPPALSVHWLFRYLHILGASIVFAGVFQYLISRQEQKEKRRTLFRWIMAGLLFQVLDGVILYASLPTAPSLAMRVTLFVGVAAAMLLLWTLAMQRRVDRRLAPSVLGVLLVAMLLTRQAHQYRGILPMQTALEQAASVRRAALRPYRPVALYDYNQSFIRVYHDPFTIFSHACAFCHGQRADGNGVEANNLAVAPEDLTQVRTNRATLRRVIRDGVNGTAMPFFSSFSGDKRESLVSFVGSGFNAMLPVDPVPVHVAPATLQRAKNTFATTCATCHAKDGRGNTALSAGFRPPPPDLTAYTLQPRRTFAVITNGYRGTMMRPFAQLPPENRWALVQVVRDIYQGQKAPDRTSTATVD